MDTTHFIIYLVIGYLLGPPTYYGAVCLVDYWRDRRRPRIVSEPNHVSRTVDGVLYIDGLRVPLIRGLDLASGTHDVSCGVSGERV